MKKINNVVAIDFGKNSAAAYDWENKIEKTFKSTEDALNYLSNLPEGTIVVGEDAHLGCPMTDKSKAQIFTERRLLDFYDLCSINGIKLKLFPQFQFPKINGMAEKKRIVKKKDRKVELNDAIVLAWYVYNINEIPMKNPPTSFEKTPIRQFGCKIKETSNITLNLLRRYGYKEDACALSKFYIENLKDTLLELNQHCQDAIGIEIGKKGQVKLTGFKDNVLLHSVLSTLVDQNMNYLYYEGTGKFLGFTSWKKYINNCSPYHLKGGVSRSNIWATVFSKYLHNYGDARGIKFYTESVSDKKKKDGTHRITKKWIKVSDFNNDQHKCFQEAKRSFRKILNEIYNHLVAKLNEHANNELDLLYIQN